MGIRLLAAARRGMMRHDIVSDVLYALNNAERFGKRTCVVPASKLVKNLLLAMQKNGYIGNFEFVDDGKSGKFDVQMIGRINKSRSIRPRFAVKKGEYEKWETRYLPAKDFGILLVSTPGGIMTQKDAMQSGKGGRLVAYVY